MCKYAVSLSNSHGVLPKVSRSDFISPGAWSDGVVQFTKGQFAKSSLIQKLLSFSSSELYFHLMPQYTPNSPKQLNRTLFS